MAFDRSFCEIITDRKGREMRRFATNVSLNESRQQVVAKGNVSATDCYVAKATGALITSVKAGNI